MSLLKEITDYKVSSVLNNDRKQFGKKYLFDGNDETCWNSDQGVPQWVQFGFSTPRTISKVKLQFQGGFVGKQCVLEAVTGQSNDGDCKFEFFPADVNSLQEFVCSSPITSQKFRLTFRSSTDFYGRIILYHFQILE